MLVWVSERGGQDMPGCPIRARKIPHDKVDVTLE